MRSADRSLGVGDEHRHAIGRRDPKEHAAAVGPLRVRGRPTFRGSIGPHDLPPVDLLDTGNAVEAERRRKRGAIARLLVERMARTRQAPLRARRETGDETERAEKGRPEHRVPLEPCATPLPARPVGGGLQGVLPLRWTGAAHFGVAYARIAAAMPAIAPMSQKRMVTFSSAQPMSSKWLCSGDMRKMRLPRSLKLPTWTTTETVSATKITPRTGNNRANPVVSAIVASVAPSASAPVSPMITSAGCTLNQRNARIAPTIAAQNTTSHGNSRAAAMNATDRKANTAVPPASPSIPSVRFTPFDIATMVNSASATNSAPPISSSPTSGT